jgi:molybdate transport system substrate-binding protein
MYAANVHLDRRQRSKMRVARLDFLRSYRKDTQDKSVYWTIKVMKTITNVLCFCCLLWAAPARAEKITVAAAADLTFALDEIVTLFKKDNPGDVVEVVYGSSGKLYAQIKEGAPYDLFFSGDIAFPRELAKNGLAASDVKLYAIGRIVLWSASQDATKMTLASLTDPKILHIAIANPKHAPYGKRAEEALRACRVWDKVKSKLVYGENITHTARFVQTGNAQVGIIALSLAVHPELASKGGYWLIPDKLHQPLEQGFIITKRAAQNALAKRFADYMGSKSARAVMAKYGFVLPRKLAKKWADVNR